jgi:hypothetical protein
MTDESYCAAMSAPIELELTHSAPLLDADPVSDAPWPLPQPCPYCTSDNEAVRAVYCNVLCPTCIQRHFEKPAPPMRSLAERIVEKTRRLLFGERSV